MSARSPSRALLAIDTSTAWLSIALAANGRVHEVHRSVGQGHAEQTLPAVQALAQEAGIALRELDAIAFGSGPGAFTGLRVACGIAQGLALAADARCVAVSAFEAMAEAMFDTHRAERVWVAVDARMSEVYSACLERRDVRWHFSEGPTVASPARGARPVGEGWYACGTGFTAFGDALLASVEHAPLVIDSTATPRAAIMLRLARAALARGEAVDPALAAPVYVRDRVALTASERAAGQVLSVGKAAA